MVPLNNLGHDLNGKSMNETQYRGMIASLMYLTASRPDIQFSTCRCARYQANPKKSQLIVVKRIFMNLKGTPSLGLWYPKCSGFDLKGYSNSDYAGCNMDMKSTSAKAEYVAAARCCANILWMKRDIELHFIFTKYQLADIFKKPLDEPTFKGLIVELGVYFWRSTSYKPFRMPIGVNYLSHSIEYAKVPSLETVEVADGLNYSMPRGLIWEDIINKLNKKTREKVVPYPRFLSLLLEHKMEGYGNDYVILNPTQVFSVHNWALKKNQAEGPLFTPYILSICSTDKPVAFEAPITSLTSKKDTKGTKPKAKVTSKEGAHPQLSSVVSASIIKPVYLDSTIPHSKYASRNEALADSTAKVDHGKTDPIDSVSQQHVLIDDTKKEIKLEDLSC
ncbi:hypothetical protein Tco_0200420 [Tanacetum coccineum]